MMGRKKQNHVYEHFVLNKRDLKSKCLVCQKELNSINSSNLMKHLKLHKDEFKEVTSLNKKQKETIKTQNSEIVNRECTNLVTVHGRALALLDDEAFQNILALVPDCNVKICSRTIRNNILEIAEILRNSMAKEFQNKMICVKIDIASLSLRSFMGINAQYLSKGTIVLKNLAMIELLERHTSEHLKEQVLFVLYRFRIGLENVYSFTTDNGANMLKMSSLLNQTNVQGQIISRNEAIENVNEQHHFNVETEDDIVMQGEDRMEDTENVSSDSESEFDYDGDTEIDDARQDEYTETITSSFSMQFHENTTQQRNIAVIRCAAHTLQLSVLDVCKRTEIKQEIDHARKVAKLLRTQKYIAEIKKAGKNQPILDCPTRWNSTVDMIQRLLELKEICENADDSNLKLTESSWNILQDYLISLLPPKELSKGLQCVQLTIGDFYVQWLLCKIKLKNINSAMSILLFNSMDKREQILFNNDAFLCAIFLDGRVNSTLSDDQRDAAKGVLMQLYLHLQNLNKDKENVPQPSTSSTTLSQSNPDTARARIELDDFLSTKYVEALSDITTLLRHRNHNEGMSPAGFENVHEQLISFSKEPLLKSSENILKHWEVNKNKYPRLYALACIILASPATQVSVERLFSSLKFVVSKYRFNLKHNLIEDIIFIRNNKLYSQNK